jgi:hypothetical protein
MIISGISRQDLLASREVASRALGNELLFGKLHSYSPKRHGVRLQVQDIDGPGARRHSHMFLMGYSQRPRRSRFACSHAHGAFYVAIYEREPWAKIQTAMAYYRNAWDFLGLYNTVLDRNAASRMCPIRFADECTCETDEIDTTTLEDYFWRPFGFPEVLSPANTKVIEGAGWDAPC